MKKISNLKGAIALSKTEQKSINGQGFTALRCGIPCGGDADCRSKCDFGNFYVCFRGTCHFA